MGNRCVVVRCALSSSHRKRVRDRARGIVRCPGQRTCGAGGSGRHRMGFARCFGRGGWRGRRSPRDPRRVAGAGEPASRAGRALCVALGGLERMPGRPACGARLVSLLSPSVRVGGGLDRGAPTPNFLGEPATAAVPSCYTHRSSPRRWVVRWVATCKALLDFGGGVVFLPSRS